MLINVIKKSLAKLSPFKKVIVGVSGGADSVALAHILRGLGYEIVIAHLNHGLRGKDSDGDEVFVKNLAQKWRVPFITCKIPPPVSSEAEKSGGKVAHYGNLENEFRKIRYQFLERVRQSQKAQFIAVAHHADDQIETILMHIKRGAGLRGMCGMRLQNNKIIRPLLMIKKDKLLAHLRKNKLNFRTDKTNFDLNFERNFVRHVVLPKIGKKREQFEQKILDLSLLAQEKLEKIEKRSQKWIKENIGNLTFKKSTFLKLPDSIQSEVIFQLIGHLDVYSHNVEDVKGLIKNCPTGKQKKAGDYTFCIEYSKIRFYKGKKPTVILKRVKLGKRVIKWGEYKIKYTGSDTIYVRSWQSGDKFKPMGMKGSKKLQDFFVDQKIPQSKRRKVPIFVNSQGVILAVSDIRFSETGKDLTNLINIVKISTQ